jgi:hypothetical protein
MARGRRRAESRVLLVWCLCTLLMNEHFLLFVLAQKRGPVSVLLVNDSEFPLEVIWLNQFTVAIDKEELTHVRTGPVLPRSVERYKSYPTYSIQVHKADDMSCKEDSPTQQHQHQQQQQQQQQCQSVVFQIVSTEEEHPTSKLQNDVRDILEASSPHCPS